VRSPPAVFECAAARLSKAGDTLFF
jgi:hypothetical protein